MSRRDLSDNLWHELASEQLRLMGVPVADHARVMREGAWYTRYLWPDEAAARAYRGWAVNRIATVRRVSKARAMDEYRWYDLYCGFRTAGETLGIDG